MNTSIEAYPFGIPDPPFALTSLAGNVLVVSDRGWERSHEAPWIPIAATGKELIDVFVAGWYIYKVPTKDKTWFPSCLPTAVAYASLLLPEAVEAVRSLQ